MDVPEVTYRLVVKPGMEIPAADQYVQLIADNSDGNIGMAFLEELPDVRCEMRVGVIREMV